MLLFGTISLFSQIDGDTVNSTSKNDTCFVSFKEIETDCLCVLPNSYIILSSDSQLKNWIRQNSSNPSCKDYYPDIDINNEVIIGISVRSGGCSSPKVEISVYKVDSLKKLDCKVNIKRRGGCAALYYKIVWIKFKKPPGGYSINVIDSRKRNKLIRIKSCQEY
jgi:hypothetical protein